MKKTLGLVLTVFLLAALALPGCTKKQGSKEIKIGAILPLTGDAAFYGISAKNAMELAKDEINNSGGIDGNKIFILYEDSQAKPDLALNVAKKLIDVNHVNVIIGAMSSTEVMALAPLVNKKRVILISPSATSHEITKAGDYVFRTIVSDVFDGTAMARFAREKDFKSAAVFYVNEAGPEGVAKAFRKNFEELGGKVVLMENSMRGERDFRSQIAKIKNRKIDMVYFALYPIETEFFVRQYRELNVNIPLFTHQLIDDQAMLRKLGSAADGIVFTSPKLTPDTGGPEVKEFFDKYSKRYGADPPNFASNAYDAVRLAALSIKKYGQGVEDIKKGLYAVKDYHGASGVLSIDRNGDVDQQMLIMTIKDGKPRLLRAAPED